MSDRLKTAQEIKTLSSRFKRRQWILRELDEEIGELSQRRRQTLRDMWRIQQRLNQIKRRVVDPIVSEHALLRYLQKIKGINLDQITKEILNKEAEQEIRRLKTGRYKAKGFTLIFRDRSVTTVVKS